MKKTISKTDRIIKSHQTGKQKIYVTFRNKLLKNAEK